MADAGADAGLAAGAAQNRTLQTKLADAEARIAELSKPKTTKVDRKAAVKQKDDGDDMTDPMDDHADLKQAGEGGSVSAGGKTVKTKPGDKVQVINNTIYVNGKKR